MAVEAPAELDRPQIRLHGPVGEESVRAFLDGLAMVQDSAAPLVLELSTTGGDADVGARIASDVRLFRERTGRRALFLGKSAVFSAGVTIMSAFPAADRWLSRETQLLIHDRSIQYCLDLNGPLAVERVKTQMLLAQIEAGLSLQEQGFRDLVDGSDIDLGEVRERARTNWYLSAEEALSRKLVGGVL
jgi:hypothetical protein